MSKKHIYIFITLVAIFGLVGCGTTETQTSPETVTINEEANTSEASITGYETPDDLIYAYIDCLNGNITADEFYNRGFDENGYTAYWMELSSN